MKQSLICTLCVLFGFAVARFTAPAPTLKSAPSPAIPAQAAEFAEESDLPVANSAPGNAWMDVLFIDGHAGSKAGTAGFLND